MTSFKSFIRPLYNKVYLSDHFAIRLFADRFFGRERHVAFHSVFNPDETYFNVNNPNHTLFYNPDNFQVLMNNLKKKSYKYEISFDDGYADNLYTLPALLKSTSTRATVFICTRYIDGDTWDFHHLLWQNLEKDSITLYFSPGTKEEKFDIMSLTQKKKLFHRLRNLLKHESVEFQKEWFAYNRLDAVSKYPMRYLNWEELKQLVEHDCIDIGYHTHSHVSFQNLSYKSAFQELELNRDKLKLNLPGITISKFALPFGDVPEKFSIKELAEEFGITDVYSTDPLGRMPGTNPRLLYAD